ncbi:MAG: sigma 54-interacting transcriptional regulator [Candidatus Cloacimonetes bacterium]|nr:sigma 54-interacting transcriptional regulator [Candidatus Cloacimonadota bacterium]
MTDLAVISKRIESFNKALKENDQETIISIGQDLIKQYQKENKPEESVVYAETILPFLTNPGKEIDLAGTLNFLGKYYCLKEEFDKAEDFLNRALSICQRFELELVSAEVNCDLGLLFRNKGIFDIAVQYLTNSIEIFNQHKNDKIFINDRNLLFSYINAIEACGIIYSQLKQYEESISYFKDALILKEKYLGDSGKISALMNLGATYSNFDIDKAQEYYLLALQEVNSATPSQHKVVLLNNLGGCLEDKKQYDEALKYYQKALKLLNESGLIRYKAPILKHISSIHYLQGRYDQALKVIEYGLELSEKSKTTYEMKDCYKLISDIYIAKNDFKIAMSYRSKYDEIKDELYQQDLRTQLSALQTKYKKSTININNLRKEKSLISEELKKAMSTDFIGESDSIKEVRRLAIEAAAYKDTRVLITGESGVGKEIIARLIHYSDTIRTGQFVDVNCCAIPDTMAESEFFGFLKGSFTGAIQNRTGYFEQADNGSLFLDEIGDMPLSLQAKLLRVLETKEIKKLGSNKSTSVSFRLISATNRDLSELIKSNKFRGDLLFRINTIEINIPPLRERKEDIEPLLNHFLKQFSSKMNKPIPLYPDDLIACLQKYEFPGNVRELKNMVERTLIFLKGNQISVEDFTKQMHLKENNLLKSYTDKCYSIKDLESQLILDTLEVCNGNQTKAAKQMGISYSTFKRKYKRIQERSSS